MRVSVVLSGLGAGGAERVVSLLVREWVADGNQVEILSFDALGNIPYYDMPTDVAIVNHTDRPRRRRPWRSILRMFDRLMFLRRHLLQSRPDVVISFLTKVNVLTLLAQIGFRVPTIICERNNPQRQDVRYGWRVLQEILSRRAILILQTHASRRAFGKRALRNARVIANPVEFAETAPEPAQNQIVAAGRLVDQKGFDFLIEAFANLAPDFPEWRLVIWGEGPLRARLEQQSRNTGCADRISLPGISRGPREWLDSGSIFVLTSRYEGFPNVLLEAMAAGRAVAAFDCDFGPSEIIENGVDGLLVAPADIAHLEDALRQLIADEACRRRLGRAARRSVERYGVAAIMKEWAQVLIDARSVQLGSRDFNTGRRSGSLQGQASGRVR